MGYIAPKTITAPKSPQVQYTPPALLNGGLDLVSKEWHIGASKTSKVLNLWFTNGELGKRLGQNYILDTETVEYPAFASFDELYKGYIIKHCGTKLYKQNPTTGVNTEIYTGLSATKGSFFKFNSNLYYKQAGKFIVWNGTTASEVIPYEPCVIINRTPTGGGNVNENYNRIGKGFINAFITDGIAVAFTLTDSNLDATPLEASIDGGNTWSWVEGIDFTVDRITGVVTTVTAPLTNTNIFKIKAYKTDTEAINSILNCLYAMPFGGQNDNRVFCGGNGTGVYYWTDISSVGVDASYWAYNNYNIIGNSDENITGFGNFYDILTIHKQTGEIFGETYTFNGTKGIFDSFKINDQYGCDCPNTLQNVNNQLVWLNSKYGVCILIGTTVESQRNALPIGRNINPQLLKETNLTSASSINFNGKYWLCVNDKVYLWDYFMSPYQDTGNPDTSAELLSWWYFDNINAYSFIEDGQDLYYINRTSGKTVKFHTKYDSLQFYDFGLGINSLYRLPMRDFGGGIYLFDIKKAFIDVRGDTRTTFDITYFTSDDLTGISEDEPIIVGTFSLDYFSLDTFTLDVTVEKATFPLLPNEKNIDLFGIEFSNNIGGRDMNISNIVLSYIVKKEKR